MLKLWKLSDPIFSSHNSVENFSASLIAEFESCFGIRIMCLDISFDEELLVCGDLHGNMVLFPLLKSTLLGAPIASEVRITPLNYFRGAHGISTVSSISITGFYPGQIDICSTGGDGCICYMEYHKDEQNLDFIGMKQVKELSLIESTSTDINSVDDLASHNYAIGFASADFIIWNLATETKVVQVSCGGWRRPHSYYLGGEMAEMKNCFAYVKDETIHVHRHWVSNGERKSFPQNLHMQFHGREMHCLRFVARDSQSDADGFQISRSTFISTGCEDGTVRLTRYALGVENWSASKLLGEHVGGSAVRSICFVSKMHTVAANVSNMPNGSNRLVAASEDRGIPFLLISVGAKRVLTSWLLGNRRRDRKETLNSSPNNETGDFVKPSSGDFSSMTFKWLSTDMPTKYSFTQTGKMVGSAKNEYSVKSDASSGSLHPETTEKGLKNSQQNICEIDWRYLAVTAFLVTSGSSRFSVCFVVVACSDATLALRALVLPCRLWFDVALLVPLSSPVLALQHVVVPIHLPTGDSTQIANAFVVISGSTDGSIAFWDLSVSIRTFMQRVSTFLVEKSFNFPKRPRTGRGSQGGRLWRSLGRTDPKINPQPGESTNGKIHNLVVPEGLSKSIEPNNSAAAFSQNSPTSSLESELNKNDFLSEICEIYPFSIQNNIHQSGVNCLHVSEVQNGQSSEFSSRHVVLSGGDDQSLCCIGFDLALLPTCVDPDKKSPDVVAIAESENMNNSPDYIWDHKCIVRFLYHSSIASAHSSAVKGIWTDGKWAFSTGLDQRVRCWQLEDHGKVTERHHLIVSVPEPEALDARACGRDCYQIAVAGRGMQMVEFCTPKYSDGER